MALIFDMLNMTRSAVWFVPGNYHSLCYQLESAVVAVAASGARRFAVYRIESFVTTRAGQRTFRVARQARQCAHALHMKGMKLFAAPCFISLAREPLHCDLF